MVAIPINALVSSDDSYFSQYIASPKQNSLSVYIHESGGETALYGGTIGPQNISALAVPSDFSNFIVDTIDRLDQQLNLDLWITRDRATADIEIFLDSEIDLGDGNLTLGIALSNLDNAAAKKRWWEVILNGSSLTSNPTLLRYALIHELGHALGLEHPFDASDGDVYLSSNPEQSATPDQTVMSYRRPAGGDSAWPTWYTDQDIAALQSIWGQANPSPGATDLRAPELIQSRWNGSELMLLFNEPLKSINLNPADFQLKLAGKAVKATTATVNGSERRVIVTVSNPSGANGNLQWRFKGQRRSGRITDQASNAWVSNSWAMASRTITGSAPAPARLIAINPQTPSSSTASMALAKPGSTQKLGGGLTRRYLSTASTGRTLQSGDLVGVVYTGRLTNGVQFDSNAESAAATGDLFTFRLGTGAVIAGFEQGLLDVPLGSRVQLKIPSALAYGATGAGERIPPNSTLIFDIQVLAMLPATGGSQITASWSRDYGFNLPTSPVPTSFSTALTSQQLGSDLADTLTGTIANDVILGLSGNDQLTGYAGNDLVIGGPGRNTARFSGRRSDYQITASDNKGTFLTVIDTVAGRDGTDWLTNISSLNFSDGAVKLTTLLKSPSVISG